MIKSINIGTRRSALAQWQANYIKKKIEEHFPEIQLSITTIKTQGDRDQTSSLTNFGGQGVFTKSIELALMEHKIDLAVHSLKDLPTEMPVSLVVSAVPERESVYDVFVGLDDADFNKLSHNSTIACGSIRRRAQLLALRPDLNIVDLRGNIETRLKKLKQNQYDGIIMAEAALIRLGLRENRYTCFTFEQMLPAVGQGAIGIQTRRDDHDLEPILQKLNDPDTYLCVSAERSFLRRLGGGCQFPVAANARINQKELLLTGLVANKNGKKIIRDTVTGIRTDAQQIGITLAEKLIVQGADNLLKKE